MLSGAEGRQHACYMAECKVGCCIAPAATGNQGSMPNCHQKTTADCSQDRCVGQIRALSRKSFWHGVCEAGVEADRVTWDSYNPAPHQAPGTRHRTWPCNKRASHCNVPDCSPVCITSTCQQHTTGRTQLSGQTCARGEASTVLCVDTHASM